MFINKTDNKRGEIMTLKDYAKHINQLIELGHGDKIVISARDDEGNSFEDVHYAPEVMSIENINSVYHGEGIGDVVCVN